MIYVHRNYRLIEESFVQQKQKPSEGINILVFATKQQKMVDITKTIVFKLVGVGYFWSE